MIERAREIKIAAHAQQSSVIVVSGLKSSCGSKEQRRKKSFQKYELAKPLNTLSTLRRALVTFAAAP